MIQQVLPAEVPAALVVEALVVAVAAVVAETNPQARHCLNLLLLFILRES